MTRSKASRLYRMASRLTGKGQSTDTDTESYTAPGHIISRLELEGKSTTDTVSRLLYVSSRLTERYREFTLSWEET